VVKWVVRAMGEGKNFNQIRRFSPLMGRAVLGVSGKSATGK